MKIAVVGIWHLGEVYAACLAKLEHSVVGIGEEGVVKNLQKGIPPLTEPGLETLLHNKKLSFSTHYEDIRNAEVVWITFDTPVGKNDLADTTPIFATLKKLLPHVRKDAVIAVSSQLPVGTSKQIMTMLKKKSPLLGYAYVPENLRLGEAVRSFMEPERVVIGASDDRSALIIQKALKKLPAEFQVMNPASAEMVKHALNAFLATSLSFIYDIADIAEREGADILAVSKALKSDSRIGAKAYLDASLGFAGGTLGRDLQYLLAQAKKHRVSLPIISAAYDKNAKRRSKIFEALKPLKKIKGKRVAILGLTYKSGTTTLRRSMALEIAEALNKKGATISLFDNAISPNNVHVAFPSAATGTLEEVLKGAHAAVVITPWNELREVDWKKIARGMKAPRLIFDTRNYLADISDRIRRTGCTYKGIGRV